MTIYSDEIKDFLDKIYFYELSHRDDILTPMFNYFREKLRNIDKLPTHRPSATFPLSRDNLFGLTIGRLEFGYEYDGVNVSVDYYVNRQPQNDWFDWLIGENKKQQDRIITEVIDQYLLKEAYLGDLYHVTTLSHLYSILAKNCIYRTVDDYGHKDSRMGNDVNVVCLTRNKNFQYKTNNFVRITLDGELISSSLRNAKIHPYNYYEKDEEPNFNAQESEERVYKSDIYPLNKYCKSIDIYVRDINRCDYYFCDDIDYAYEGLAKIGNDKPSDSDINLWFLKHITKDFPSFSHLINIHGYDTMNENKYYKIISEVVNQYLKQNLILN